MFDFISTGRYWDKPWSLISGCTPCSPGCTHCWALAMERRFRYKPFAGDKSGLHDISIQLHPERLDIPLKRRKPTAFSIWNDIAHESVPEKFRVRVFDIMAQCPQHIFLMLTKRIGIMSRFEGWVRRLPNVWPGVTICNQPEADEKIPLLLQIPAAVHFISYEPALGPLLIKWWLDGNHESGRKPSWLICGGETGPGARPMHPDWVRSVRDQCQAAEVPLFFKSWGEWAPRKHHGIHDEGRPWGTLEHDGQFNPSTTPWNGRDDVKAWDGLHEAVMIRIGKKAAGRLLDGRTWDEIPERRSKCLGGELS